MVHTHKLLYPEGDFCPSLCLKWSRRVALGMSLQLSVISFCICQTTVRSRWSQASVNAATLLPYNLKMTSLVDITPISVFVQSLTKLMRPFVQSNCKVHFGGERRNPGHWTFQDITGAKGSWWSCAGNGEMRWDGSSHRWGALWTKGALLVSRKLLSDWSQDKIYFLQMFDIFFQFGSITCFSLFLM